MGKTSALLKIGWLIVSLVAAAALAVVVGVWRPQENVNALWLVVAALCIYALSYRFYCSFIASKVLALDSNRIPPSFRLKDGMDYQPTPRWVLFGHHFAAISGAGPIIGPTLAAQFGYLPGFLWILIGATLGGAVHDMIILLASVRRNGHSLAQIVKEELGVVSGMAAAFVILFNIIVAVSGSGLAVINALAGSAWGTFTVSLTIPIAIAMGFYLFKFRPGKIREGSIIGALLLLAAVYAGRFIPDSSLAPFFTLSRNHLILFIGALSFLSSVLPVWVLLCPRDYISTYIKIGTFLLLVVGIFIMSPTLQMPSVTRYASEPGPIIPGTVFPFLFITIACGAISGFHGLISSGTTPKMVMSEADIPLIGYGAMLTESLVAVTALIAASILIPGDYFAINAPIPFDQLAALGFPVGKITEFSQQVGIELAGRPGGPVSLAVGMSAILSGILGGAASMPYWYNFAIMFQALFILTLVDTGTRVGRFILQEIGGAIYKPIATHRTALNIWITSFIIVFLWVYLIHAGSISTIWPMFGVANQLLAAVAFGVGTTLIIKSGKARYAWTTLIPMAFMYVTTFTAAWQLIGVFSAKAARASTGAEALNLRIDQFLIVTMVLLAILILADMSYKWHGYLNGTRDPKLSEVA
ncbi:MAG TPA: carbon starvation protein A [Elusimicrobiota bacterium]|nr:carbon starvation protein A [Elusimicrobiota bacterium]